MNFDHLYFPLSFLLLRLLFQNGIFALFLSLFIFVSLNEKETYLQINVMQDLASILLGNGKGTKEANCKEEQREVGWIRFSSGIASMHDYDQLLFHPFFFFFFFFCFFLIMSL